MELPNFCKKLQGTPYALNPQESEHLCEARLAGFSRIIS